ncbi:hypothetical protein ABMA28_015463 [Loxostege sticticalis]|uniref:Uncharacterized protein n=1 Tax=Loxostege sticticalis TaxID=481309 RepID=A0ABD0T9Z6_LOXSC
MADDFIPLNQSTPVQGKWQNRNQSYRGHQQNNRFQNNQRRGGHNNRWGNNSQRNSSYGSDSNSSFGQDKSSIDAYLHPSMLQDPWAHLRQGRNSQQT